MALLRTESGEIYTSVAKINEIIAPNEIGEFFIPEDVRKHVATPIDKEAAQELYQFVPQALTQYCANKKIPPSSAWCVWEGSDLQLKKRVSDSGIPHIDYGDEVHVCFAGSLIFYFDQNNKQFALVLQAGDWIFIEKSIPVWVKPTKEYFFTFASYHSDPKDQAVKNFVVCADKKVL